MESFEKAQNIQIINTATEGPPWNVDLYKAYLKRVLDLVFGLLLLPFILPALLLCMLTIKLDSKGPVIFKSERIGRNGKKFFIFKLRTMCLDAEQKLQKILNENSAMREEWEKDQKLRNDPRVTRLGKVIRTLSLDELPQIFNVLRGDMSFVGPRPIVENEIRKYGIKAASYISVRPGITGLWQVSGRSEAGTEGMIMFDPYYVRNWSLWLDLVILFRTLRAVWERRGAY